MLGSLDRQVAHLIDTYGGAFPPWLAPVQIVALPVTDAQLAGAKAVERRAADVGLRALTAGGGSLAARIRAHRLVPYQAVIGAAEAAADEVSIRLRDGRKLPPMSVGAALARIARHVHARPAELWDER